MSRLISLSLHKGSKYFFSLDDLYHFNFQNGIENFCLQTIYSIQAYIWRNGPLFYYKPHTVHTFYRLYFLLNNIMWRASLVVQWLRICLSMQGTWVQSLVQEHPTCLGATKPVHHNYESLRSRACAPQQEKPPQWKSPALQLESSPRLPQIEKVCTKQ